MGREYTAVLESLNVPYEIKAADFEAHYSSKVDRCLLLIRKITSVSGQTSDITYLLDATTRQMYALYVGTDRRIETCALIPSVQEPRPCKDRPEFDAYVRAYIEK